jgi:hypothetical protein
MIRVEAQREPVGGLAKRIRAALAVGMLLATAGCDGFRGLRVGETRLADVERIAGQAAMRWDDADGSVRLAYPAGPMGYQTRMLDFDAGGVLRQVEMVLDENHFARVRPGMSGDQVLRELGPSNPAGTVYFKARDERVWEWRYCDAWNASARFEVLFDGASGEVRSTQSVRDTCGKGACWCAH